MEVGRDGRRRRIELGTYSRSRNFDSKRDETFEVSRPGRPGPRISFGHLRLVVDLGRLPVPKPPATWPGDNGQGGVTDLWGLFALGQMFLVDPV
jgi:hypothetical protein